MSFVFLLFVVVCSLLLCVVFVCCLLFVMVLFVLIVCCLFAMPQNEHADKMCYMSSSSMIFCEQAC